MINTRPPRVIDVGPVTLTPCDEFEIGEEETIVELDLNEDAVRDLASLLIDNINQSRPL